MSVEDKPTVFEDVIEDVLDENFSYDSRRYLYCLGDGTSRMFKILDLKNDGSEVLTIHFNLFGISRIEEHSPDAPRVFSRIMRKVYDKLKQQE